MDVSVKHDGTGDSCVVGVPKGGTVLGLKTDALEEMFGDSVDTTREAAAVAAHIEGCEDELDDAERVADTGLEDGGSVQLVPRWPNVKAPAVYSSTHNQKIKCITLSRCGTLCAVGYDNGHMTVFNTIAADVVADVTYGNKVNHCTAFSRCGTWLATCSSHGTVCVWLTATWEQVCILDHDNTDMWGATWSHCGRLVSGSDSGQVRVWDLKGTPSATVLEGCNEAVRSIAVSATKIFGGSLDNNIHVWDISTLAHTHTLDGHTEEVTGIVLTKDEHHLVSCSDDKSFKVWCTTSLRCLRTVELGDYTYSLAVSQPGDVVAVEECCGANLFRLGTGENLGKVDTQGYGVALSPCGRWLFTPTDSTSFSVRVSSVSP